MNKLTKSALFGLLGLLLCSHVFGSTFEDLVGDLLTKSNKEKSKAIDALGQVDDPRVLPVLNAMLDAKLFFIKEDETIVIVAQSDKKYQLTDVITSNELGLVEKKAVKKIRINNKLRRVLRSNIANLELNSSDSSLRLKSAKNILKAPDPSLKDKLNSALRKETNTRVRNYLDLAIAIIDVKESDQDKRFAAVTVLSQSVEPEAIAELNKLTEKDEQGAFLEQNTELAAYAEKKLQIVKSKLDLFKFFENLLFGLSLGSILLLAAIGLAITFGVMGVINMAHGEMIMLGAYTTFAIQQIFPELIQISLLLAIPAAFLVSGTAGILIERFVIRHLYGRPLDTLLATFGISLILQQSVRMYSSNNVAVVSPEWISGFWQVNGALALTYNRIYILIFSLVVLALLALLLKKTMVGLQMRAVTQNRAMANSMGIRSNWVDALTFGLGSGIAGIAGVALSQITNVGPNLGQGYIIDSFMVVVFGGVGNLMGTFLGALSLGVANKFLEPYAGAVVGKIIVLIFIILFIQWRPRGMFALKGRFVED